MPFDLGRMKKQQAKEKAEEAGKQEEREREERRKVEGKGVQRMDWEDKRSKADEIESGRSVGRDSRL